MIYMHDGVFNRTLFCGGTLLKSCEYLKGNSGEITAE